MRRYIKTFLVCTLCLVLVSCNDPFPKRNETTCIDKYGEYDKYVNNILDENFRGSLPSKISDKNVMNYHYFYNSPVFDFPSFYIGLEIEFDAEAFKNEYDRITTLDGVTVSQKDNVSYIILSGCDSIEEFCNDMIYDAWRDYVEIVEFNKNNGKVRYLVAWMTDSTIGYASDYFNVIEGTNSAMQEDPST